MYIITKNVFLRTYAGKSDNPQTQILIKKFFFPENFSFSYYFVKDVTRVGQKWIKNVKPPKQNNLAPKPA